jgi:adenylate cyclase class IV
MIDASGDNEEPDEVEAGRRALAQMAAELGLRNSERRSYLELLMSKAE